MAESPLDRLKRLAVEKKAAVVPVAQPVVSEESKNDRLGSVQKTNAAIGINAEVNDRAAEGTEPRETATLSSSETSASESGTTEQSRAVCESTGTTVANGNQLSQTDSPAIVLSTQASSEVEVLGNSSTTNEPANISNHPLAMQFAELESALLATDPEFKTILRQIHKHLGNEPELVTQMTEREIQMVVQGLIVFANAEVVAPAKAKSEKAKIAAAKKVVISADDL